MNSNVNDPSRGSFTVIRAHLDDTDTAFRDLNRDMDPRFVHVFLDKIQRYAKKPDRALFLAKNKEQYVGFSTIIDKSPLPDEFSDLSYLKKYACGTGLMVLPEYRAKGVGALFVKEWELWVDGIGAGGVWLVTRKMEGWYQRHFDYELLGETVSKGVKKTVLVKHL